MRYDDGKKGGEVLLEVLLSEEPAKPTAVGRKKYCQAVTDDIFEPDIINYAVG